MVKRNFGELEQEILHVLQADRRMTVKEVHQKLGGKYTTVMTVMGRLAKKGVLERERMGLQHEYWLAKPVEKIPSFLEQIKKKVFGVKTSVMVNYLIESADDISDQDLVEMEKMIEKAKASRK